jgi:hypothetical protein
MPAWSAVVLPLPLAEEVNQRASETAKTASTMQDD